MQEDTQNCNLLKAPPFSSFPTQVRAYIDDEFHSFVGCASEAVAFSHMPPFKDKTVRLESHCACCLAPVTLVSKNFELQSVDAARRVAAHLAAPFDWNNVDMLRMCDSMNYVIDAHHAERYERQTATRGVLVNLDQAKMFVQDVANERMWNYHWKPGTLNPKAVDQGLQDDGRRHLTLGRPHGVARRGRACPSAAAATASTTTTRSGVLNRATPRAANHAAGRVDVERGIGFDERRDPFAHERVGIADGHRVAHVGCASSTSSTSAGADVLAAADDDVLQAADDLDHAVSRSSRGRRCGTSRRQ